MKRFLIHYEATKDHRGYAVPGKTMTMYAASEEEARARAQQYTPGCRFTIERSPHEQWAPDEQAGTEPW